MEDNELTSRLTTVLSELRDVMQQRKDKIEQLRAQITQIENENEDLERKVYATTALSLKKMVYQWLSRNILHILKKMITFGVTSYLLLKTFSCPLIINRVLL